MTLQSKGLDLPKIGISSCLLGNQVRYDGGHQHDRFLTDTFGKFVQWVPVCPEVELGLPVPRPSMRLEGSPTNPRLIVNKTRQDLTKPMQTWAKKRVKQLEAEGLMGFIFKSKSPSSGMERVKVWSPSGMATKEGVGIFAKAFMDHFPLLPVEEDGRLHDIHLRENFVEQIFCLMRYRQIQHPRKSLGGLVSFHAQHKLQLMAHQPAKLKTMGQLVAKGKQLKIGELFIEYEKQFLECLKMKTSFKKNTNVLQHMLGYFKNMLTPDEKEEMLEIINQYRQGLLPLIVPITLLQHYVRKYDEPYLKSQTYINPHPIELKLRNHA
jgi:uncharacterized protein YbgA (DUF1722 family)/uncharacterized protein YbbK (DUF523 family)